MSSSDCDGHGSVVADVGDAGWLAAFGVNVAVAALRLPMTGELEWSERWVSSGITTKKVLIKFSCLFGIKAKLIKAKESCFIQTKTSVTHHH